MRNTVTKEKKSVPPLPAGIHKSDWTNLPDSPIISRKMAIRTRQLNVNTRTIDPEDIEVIAGVLKHDGIIVFPTDTYYGLGANCFSGKAIRRIYNLKKRDSSKPISVLISNLTMLERITTDRPDVFGSLASKFWPGPLTLILKAAPGLPANLLGFSDTIGVRLPDFLWIRSLLENTEFPITATSANISGSEEMSNPEKVIRLFNGKADLIANGGETRGIIPSTVLDLTTPAPKILRDGAIPSKVIEEFIISVTQ